MPRHDPLSTCGGLNHTAQHVWHVTVRCPSRPGLQEHGDQPTSTFGGIRRWPFGQMFGNHSPSKSERMFEY
jgi:hypothetical protein